jgi:hypothetical protein
MTVLKSGVNVMIKKCAKELPILPKNKAVFRLNIIITFVFKEISSTFAQSGKKYPYL